jgi:nucleoside-diphosphate-sugar epimerase
MGKLILSKGSIPVVGEGKARWNNVHIEDLSDLYRLLTERAIAQDKSDDLWGPHGYMFAGNGEHLWTDLAKTMAHEAEQQGSIKNPKSSSLSKDAALEQAGFEAVSWGLNSRAKAERAREFLGWKPHRASLEQTVPEIIQQESRLLTKS